MDTRDLTPEEVVELLKGLEAINKIDMSNLEAPKPTSTARLVEAAESKGAKTAMTQAARGGRRKAHWKERKRKQRERMRPYMAEKYRRETLPKRTKMVEEGDWWAYYVMEWKKRGYKIELTKAEWEQEVAPTITAKNVPIIFRFNTAKPVALHNLMVKDADTKEVLFDGQEWMLKKIGATQ